MSEEMLPQHNHQNSEPEASDIPLNNQVSLPGTLSPESVSATKVQSTESVSKKDKTVKSV